MVAILQCKNRRRVSPHIELAHDDDALQFELNSSEPSTHLEMCKRARKGSWTSERDDRWKDAKVLRGGKWTRRRMREKCGKEPREKLWRPRRSLREGRGRGRRRPWRVEEEMEGKEKGEGRGN